MEDIDKNGDGFIDLEEYIGEWYCIRYDFVKFETLINSFKNIK